MADSVEQCGQLQGPVSARFSSGLARPQAMAGDKEAARKSYQDFLTLWKDADPDIPIYRQAKAEYANLMKSRQPSVNPPHHSGKPN
jgi:hypothetical protein